MIHLGELALVELGELALVELGELALVELGELLTWPPALCNISCQCRYTRNLFGGSRPMLVFTLEHVTYRQERVDCGRACGKCPHGPYWYSYQRINGRLDKRYVGAKLPPAVLKFAPVHIMMADGAK